jgi:alpha-glucan,water dikinase
VYKDRALQSPWVRGPRGNQLTLVLASEDPVSAVDFVVKDPKASLWFDHQGGNFHIPLEPRGTRLPNPLDQRVQVPAVDVPQELAGIWAYIKWECAGCPERSQAGADEEFQKGIAELKQYLRDGVPLERLWAVARGEEAYQDFVQSFGGGAAPAKVPAKAEGAAKEAPEELVNLQAYILWEQQGKPDGADFGPEAAALIEGRLRAGESAAEIEASLRTPAATPVVLEKAAAAPEAPAADPARTAPKGGAPPAPAAGPSAATAPRVDLPPLNEMGSSLGSLSASDALSFIKPMDEVVEVPDLVEKDPHTKSPLTPLVEAAGEDESVFWKRLYPMGKKASLLAVVRQEGEGSPITLTLTTDTAHDAVLHWGVCKKSRGGWALPPKSMWGPGTEDCGDGLAVDTPLRPCGREECTSLQIGQAVVPVQQAVLTIPADHPHFGLTFVVKSVDETEWWKDGPSNFMVPLPGGPQPPVEATGDELLKDIIDAESSNAWTLMHRYNKSADLLDQILQGRFGGDRGVSMAKLYVCLRLSSIRQLTWQRNYNTQPRILSGAQERLTGKIAEAHRATSGEAEAWVRLMLTCVGRGGDGQRIRDDILHIMHRHKIKEVKGTWMEEWHQKLHNNTTPDDVSICEAYLAFLENGGNRGLYWQVLSEAGISRERLESFERPIRCEPEDFPDRRDGLIKDFREYLRVLKSVHSGADLQSAVATVSDRLPSEARHHVGYLLGNVGNPQVLPFIEAAVAVRVALQPALKGDRDMLYLDLALEQAVRSAAEQGVGSAGAQVSPLVGPLLQNLCLSAGNNTELCYCLKAWATLPHNLREGGHFSKSEALQASAVVDRMRRAVAELSDSMSEHLQPAAAQIGGALECENWAVELFSEEVVRSSPAFAVSLALSVLDPVIRATAELGSWQIISPVTETTGRLAIADELYPIQDEVFPEPTLLLAKSVSGEEEIPENCVGVITPDSPDVLSHISVRARNSKTLLATCFSEEPLADLRKLSGQPVKITTTARGDVEFREVGEAELTAVGSSSGPGSQEQRSMMKIKVPVWSGKWAVGMDAFKDNVVGAKSKNLAAMRGKIPASIGVPASVTLPFGCYEECLKHRLNAQVSKEIGALLDSLKSGDADLEATLQQCQDLAMGIKVPEALCSELSEQMRQGGIDWPEGGERWHAALTAVKSVWASQYNLRAFVSLKKAGLNFRDIRMAVLVQRMADAQYSFVIHTTNPATGDSGEIYAEVVRGLGEVLVGNYPGRAFSFTGRKDCLDEPNVEAFPSKSVGLFHSESLIFRSDSNGEDLDGYAGAGLYDSVPMDETEERPVDYSSDPLLTDSGFQHKMMVDILRVGAAIERSLGPPQDIEGCIDSEGRVIVVQTRPQV